MKPTAKGIALFGLGALTFPLVYETTMRILGRSTLDPTHHR